MMYFNFYGIFLEFSITGQVETDRNDNFNFLPFSACLNLFWLEEKPLWYFLIFYNFQRLFLEFSISSLVGIDRNDNFHFLSFWPYPTYFGLKRSHNDFFFFFFLLFFWNSLLQVKEELIGMIIFTFFLFQPILA